MVNEQPFEGTSRDAQADWLELSMATAEGAEPPPASLLQVVGKAAGGLPKGVSPKQALRASAALLNLLKGNKQ